ncbi:hypothetical protein PsorP6_014944 [Peronosclerospora sorghi]|uniref:Uncharacterized protein n=1 Tax=Peronosclerospora sorghi TaxID=230839 RepID=A0ACC0VTJ3_9STRA|nr:hypothetical protein PsorP6_014944 [Peronosclerospora sorghi]
MRVSLFAALSVATAVTSSVHSTSAQSNNYKHTKDMDTVVRVLRSDIPDEDDLDEDRALSPQQIQGLVHTFSEGDDLTAKLANFAKDKSEVKNAIRNAPDGDEAQAAATIAQMDHAAKPLLDQKKQVEALLKNANDEELAQVRAFLTDEGNKRLDDFMEMLIMDRHFDDTIPLAANWELVDPDEAARLLAVFMKNNKEAVKGMTPGQILQQAGIVGLNADIKQLDQLFAIVQTITGKQNAKKERTKTLFKLLGVTALGVIVGVLFASVGTDVKASTSTSNDL